jgi:hypothetical protein
VVGRAVSSPGRRFGDQVIAAADHDNRRDAGALPKRPADDVTTRQLLQIFKGADQEYNAFLTWLLSDQFTLSI